MTCTLTHAEHAATWKSWRDDCTDLDGCGFAMRDEDQCHRGHPDDGITWCAACGHFDPVGHAALEQAASLSRQVPLSDVPEADPMQEVIVIAWPFPPETHAEDLAQRGDA